MSPESGRGADYPSIKRETKEKTREIKGFPTKVEAGRRWRAIPIDKHLIRLEWMLNGILEARMCLRGWGFHRKNKRLTVLKLSTVLQTAIILNQFQRRFSQVRGGEAPPTTRLTKHTLPPIRKNTPSYHLWPMGLNVAIPPVVTKDLPISPRFTPYTIFYRDASSAFLQLVNQWLNFTY